MQLPLRRMNMHPNCTTVPRAPYPEFTQTDTQYIIKGNISSAGGDYVAVNYYPYTRDNGENYYNIHTLQNMGRYIVLLRPI